MKVFLGLSNNSPIQSIYLSFSHLCIKERLFYDFINPPLISPQVPLLSFP